MEGCCFRKNTGAQLLDLQAMLLDCLVGISTDLQIASAFLFRLVASTTHALTEAYSICCADAVGWRWLTSSTDTAAILRLTMSIGCSHPQPNHFSSGWIMAKAKM